MDEPNPFNQLLKYAKENGLACETHLDEKRLLLSPNGSVGKKIWIAF